MTVALQLAGLYIVLGGPQTLVARVAGYDAAAAAAWGRMQIGFPLALAMAFPALIVLAIIDRWLHPVGMLDVLGMQVFFLMLWLRWLGQDVVHVDNAEVSPPLPAAVPAFPPPSVASTMPPVPVIPVVSPATAPTTAITVSVIPASSVRSDNEPISTQAVPPAPTFTPPGSGGPAPPVRWLARLRRQYVWDVIGLERPFLEARKQTDAIWLTRGDVLAFGEARFARLRGVAHDCLERLARHESPTGVTGKDDGVLDRYLERDDYEDDVMRRLVCSVVLKHDALFIDQTDRELCGDALLVIMYRLALQANAMSQAKLAANSPLH